MEEPKLEVQNKTVESIPAVTIRFAGDSGDGMQLVGTRFTDTSALFGNDCGLAARRLKQKVRTMSALRSSSQVQEP